MDAENNRVPDQLRGGAGIRDLTAMLVDKFCTQTNRKLFCIKAAIRSPDPQSSLGRMLGVLTTIGDTELLSFRYQGKNYLHCADYVLDQASAAPPVQQVSFPGLAPLTADPSPYQSPPAHKHAYICMLSAAHQPVHTVLVLVHACTVSLFLHDNGLTCGCTFRQPTALPTSCKNCQASMVIISSDGGFQGRVMTLIRRGFEVVVLYTHHQTSHKPEGLLGTTPNTHEWIHFLKENLNMPHLTLSAYDRQERYSFPKPGYDFLTAKLHQLHQRPVVCGVCGHFCVLKLAVGVSWHNKSLQHSCTLHHACYVTSVCS